MNRDRRFNILLFLAIILVPVIVLLLLNTGKSNYIKLPYYGESHFSNEKGDTIHFRVPAFSFTDQKGKMVSSNDFAGKIKIVSFFYSTCSGHCDMLFKQLKELQKGYMNVPQVAMLSFSLKPQLDSVENLNSFFSEWRIEYPQWRLLTGDSAAMTRIVNEGFLSCIPGKKELIKSTPDSVLLHHVFLVDQNDHIRGIYDGTDVREMQRLDAEIRVLLITNDKI